MDDGATGGWERGGGATDGWERGGDTTNDGRIEIRGMREGTISQWHVFLF